MLSIHFIASYFVDAPTFLEPIRNVTIDHRGDGKLECRVDGTPYPTVKFMKDWRPVTESSRVKIVHEAPNYWSLSLENALSSDVGHYECVAENAAGKAVSSAKITVEGKFLETLLFTKLFAENHTKGFVELFFKGFLNVLNYFRSQK